MVEFNTKAKCIKPYLLYFKHQKSLVRKIHFYLRIFDAWKKKIKGQLLYKHIFDLCSNKIHSRRGYSSINISKYIFLKIYQLRAHKKESKLLNV